jgi:hypothetical protein
MELLGSLVLLLFATLASANIPLSEVNDKFKDFKERFNKTYESKFKELVAKIYFRRALEYIDRENNIQSFTFNLTINQFSDQNPEVIKNFTSIEMRPPPMISGRAIIFLNPADFPPGKQSGVN